MNKVIDLEYVKKEQESFISHLKTIEGIKYPDSGGKGDVPKWLVISLICELIEVVNESKCIKWWDNAPINKERLKEELADLLAHIGNVSNYLCVDLKIEKELPMIKDLKAHVLGMLGDFTTLGFSKYYARNKLVIITQKYMQLVKYFGYNMNDIKEAYLNKMKMNYRRFE